MDVRYVNPFMSSVKEVFTTMLEAELLISKPCIRSDDDPSVDVSAVIGLSGDAVGSVALCFPMRSAERAASRFAGTELSRKDEDFADALGELANMVAGGAKAKLEGLSCSIGLPNVIIGKDLILSQSKVSPRLALPCESALGSFCVEIALSTSDHGVVQPSK